jgi:hypothetical protein
MGTPTNIKNHVADGAVSPFRIVKPGAADGKAAQASAATDALMGISGELAAADGERLDVVRAGIADVEYGGTVTRGAPITADASGRAVAAAPAAGANVRIIGFAEVSAVLGDIAPALIAPGVMQG